MSKPEDKILASLTNLIAQYENELDFLHNQEVKLQANLDIGRVYNKCTELPNNASLDIIKQQLSTLKD